MLITHIGLAQATKTPELLLEEKEAKALAEASARVMAEFDIRPDPRFIAVAGLVSTAAAVYGPRIVAIRIRRINERNSEPANRAQFEVDATYPGRPSIDPGNFNLSG